MKEIGVMIRQAVRAIAKGTDIPVCVMVVGRDVLECSNKMLLEVWKEEISQLQKGRLTGSESGKSKVCMFECTLTDQTACTVLTDQEHQGYRSYICAMLHAAYDSFYKKKEDLAEISKRRLLASQLLGGGRLDFETDLKDIPRCAVLLSASFADDGTTAGEIVDILEKWGEDKGILTKEDICGFVNNSIVIFKSVGSLDYREYREEVDRMCDEMITHIANVLDDQAVANAFAGSAYSRADQLYKSFEEARYLFLNFDYYGQYKRMCYYINDYIFEYLYSRLDIGEQENMIRDFKIRTEQSEIIRSLMMPMAIHNMSPKICADVLGIHINTMQQRLKKMKDRLGIDPLHDIRNRALIHIYALQDQKKIIWNAGVIVQPDSILFQGLSHLSEILDKKSKGIFQLNIHTVATSGDNFRLFGLLRERDLDMAVGSTIGLRQLADMKISVLQYPFLFESEEEARFVLQNLVLPEVQSSLSEGDVLCFDIWSMGWRYLTSKNAPIIVPEDMKGRKIRILASDDIKEYFEEMGAVPVQIYYNNIREALASDMIECQENPYNNIWNMRIYEYQRYITEMKMFYSMEACCVARQSWSELDQSKQSMLKEAIRENSRWVLRQQKEINQLARSSLIKEGLEIVVPTEEEIRMWRQKSQAIYRKTKYLDFLSKIEAMKSHYHRRVQN